MSVFDNLAFPLKVRRRPAAEIRSRVARALELVGLKDYADRKPRQLSGGQQQRVALARAIVYDPPVLLMDEPLGALDKKLRERLQLEIKQIQTNLGVTVIYVTHDQEEALVMSDRIAVMNRGRIEQIGTPSELYHRSANAFVADFIGQSNLIAGTVVSLRGRECTVRIGDLHDVSVSVDTDWSEGHEAVVVLRPENVNLAPDNGQGNDQFSGVIQGVAFVGDSTKYTVQSDQGPIIVARIQRSSAAFSAGDRVKISWDTVAARLIKRSDLPQRLS
jgi:ABC-type Fe3+/spermidine/putrescine transport system ATPase subunit